MTLFLIGVAVIVIVIIVVTVLIMRTMRGRGKLRGQFGSEYDRAVKDRGNWRAAERDLHDRQNRVEDMEIRPLAPAARDFYHAEWTRVQDRFVDTPEDALSDADQLVRRVMADRGYETSEFQQRVADLSVKHAPALDHYRRAHDISARAARKEASTEDLRQAMVHYRTLFDDLLADSIGERPQNGGQPSRTAPDLPHTPRKG
ncbi:hypothetical protein [Actinomadura macra]|uniref:hypothetical protein n=1 Tax=Actinomadura macra TaxID=46164 RepID=UPI0008344B72|nr:hypothetical protein [Actinomadura macra]